MKTILFLLSALACVAADRSVLNYTTCSNKLVFTYQVKAGYSYDLIRFDIASNYHANVTNHYSATNGTFRVVHDPLKPTDEDQPKPSGQCWFYLIETKRP